jgi:integrase
MTTHPLSRTTDPATPKTVAASIEGGLAKIRKRRLCATVTSIATPAANATLQTVLDRLATDASLSASRKRDLCSAVTIFAKLRDQAPAAILLDLAAIRDALDHMEPAWAQISRKRWQNIRSGVAAAIAASGLRPMLKTSDLPLDRVWARLLARAPQRVRLPLLRFARWASLREIAPQVIDDRTFARFFADLEAGTLVRNLRYLPRAVTRAWNALVALRRSAGLRPVAIPAGGRVLTRIPWERLPVALREDVGRYLTWASVPDPLADEARPRALGTQTLRLQGDHIHSAVSAAVAAGIPLKQLTSLARLVESETFRTLLRHRWKGDGGKLTAYTHGIAITLIAIATEWVQAPAAAIATLKALRSKLGALPSGLTPKNQTLLRTLDDPRLVADLIQLPDRIWHAARRRLPESKRALVDLQSALAIDVLIHVPLRIRNLTSLKFGVHLHWPQGRHRPALLSIGETETKNKVRLEFELPTALADRLLMFRDEIAPLVTGERPQTIFVTWRGKPKRSAAIQVAIEKTVLRYLGLKITPHQFRHLAAKIILDANPGAYELIRQLLGHTSLRTTTSFYAGIDTRRAGRAHADLLMKLREAQSGRRGRHCATD